MAWSEAARQAAAEARRNKATGRRDRNDRRAANRLYKKPGGQALRLAALKDSMRPRGK